ncbi:hypothetical protein ACFQX6_36160 [Streptosporangium lutulentum]
MPSLRRAISIGALAVLPILAAVLPALPAHADQPLRAHAEARGKFIGTALSTSPWRTRRPTATSRPPSSTRSPPRTR